MKSKVRIVTRRQKSLDILKETVETMALLLVREIFKGTKKNYFEGTNL
jgi:hypothetical protein